MGGKGKRATWQLHVQRRSVDADGVAVLQAELRDGGELAATVRVRVTPDRALRFDVELQPGAELSGFQAWASEARTTAQEG